MWNRAHGIRRHLVHRANGLARRRGALEQLEPRLAMAAIQDWQPRGAGGGGALFSPSINPSNPSEIYIASDMGQVFHTTDAGTDWDTVDHRELHGSNNARVHFTVDPALRYALDYAQGGDVVRPARSTDGGHTWTPLSADPTSGEAISLLVDYRNPQRLLISDYRRLWISTDGGATFQLRFSTSASDGLHLGGAFFDGNAIFVGTNQGVLVSTNNDGSFQVAPWSGIPTDQRIVSFAGAAENGTTRFWAVTAAAGDVYGGVQGWEHGGFRGIYTIDAGQTAWRASTSGLTSGATPFFVAAALNDVDSVYVSGGSNASRPTVFRSTDGGNTWQSVLLTAGNANVATAWAGDGGVRGWSYGENALGFTVSALDPSQVVFTDYGFAYLSRNGGTSWEALTVVPADRNAPGTSISLAESYRSSGLDNTSTWDLAWASASRLVGAYSDIRGVISSDGGLSWSFNYTGHTQNSMYRSVVHPSGTLYAATATVHDLYQSTHLTDSSIDGGSGRVLYSTNQGTTWQTLHDFGHVVSWVELDPQHPNRLYASVAHRTDGGIYVSDDIQNGAASTWRRLAAPPRTEGHAYNLRVLHDGTLVASYSGRRAGSPLAFTASSGVFVSTDGGQIWQDRSHAGMRYWTKDVVIDPHDAQQNTWYASVFSGWGGAPNGLGGLYRTTDRGLSWTRISALDRVNSVTVSPTNPNEAYLTTEVDGLWYTDRLRDPSPLFTPVAGFSFQQPMRVLYNPYDPSQVWVTTFGGGLWSGGTVPEALPGRIQFGAAQYVATEQAGAVQITVTRTGGSSGAVTVDYATQDGTAFAGQDYQAMLGTLSWADGDASLRTITVGMVNDSDVETDETFNVLLSNPAGGATLGVPATTTGTILDNDDPPPPPPAASQISLDRSQYDTREDYGYRSLYIVRSGDLTRSASVRYATRDGSARAGSDYQARTGTLTFQPGVRQLRIDVPLVNDKVLEATENFMLELSDPIGAELGAYPVSTVSVRDDEINAPGVFQFHKAVYSTRENWGYVRVYVTRTDGYVGTVSVSYATGGGTAVPNSHYRPVSGVLTFADGETTKYFDVPLINNRVRQASRTVGLTLSTATGGGLLGSQKTAVIQIEDDD